MADQQQNGGDTQQASREPRGFGAHTRGLSGEYAHEQGWSIDEEERKRRERSPQDTDGGNDYNYGARDFGDEPVNMTAADREALPEELKTEGPGHRALDINLHSNKENR